MLELLIIPLALLYSIASCMERPTSTDATFLQRTAIHAAEKQAASEHSE